MQILALAIYKGNERRVVRFKPGQLNVITGWPGTGKSSLLEIVEYCLGRTEPTFARGALDAVEWYGLLVEHQGSRVFVARPAPAVGASTASTAMLQLVADDIAEASELVTNADTDTLREELTRLLGIEENVAAVPGFSREPLRATIAQALLFCFQRQGEISKPDQLFHRSNEDFISQAIKDTLPYFLGAVDSEHVARRFRVQELRRELRRLRRELDQLTQTQTEADVRAAALVSEAAATGLVSLGRNEDADDLTVLRRVLETPEREPDEQNALLRERLRLRRARRELGEELRRVQEQRAALQELRQERGAFRSEVGEQRARLRSLGILREVEDGELCPICEQPLPHEDATTRELRRHIAELDTRLANERTLEPQRHRIAAELRERAQTLRANLRRVNEAATSIASDSELDAYTEQAERRAFVRGRITQFLEGLRAAEPGHATLLERRAAELEAEIVQLDDALDPTTVAREVESRLYYVNQNITAWARELGLEHSEDGVRFDLAHLTVIANDRRSPILLHRIGSAANQVGYHIVTHLALHRWFVEEERPVPRFLFLDQPEQAYFPEDMPAEVRDPTEQLSDLDQERVRTLYTFIKDITEQLAGAMQVIVVGHWNPAGVDWFRAARVENWRHGEALVPAEWRIQE